MNEGEQGVKSTGLHFRVLFSTAFVLKQVILVDPSNATRVYGGLGTGT